MLSTRKQRLTCCNLCRILWADIPVDQRWCVEVAEQGDPARMRAVYNNFVNSRVDVVRAAAACCFHEGFVAPFSEVLTRLYASRRPSVTAAEQLIIRMLTCVAYNGPQLAVSQKAVSVARAAYDDRGEDGRLANDRLAVLADLLDDEGCENDALLSHLRDSEPHFRGCWALDACLDAST